MPPHCDTLDGPVVTAARKALDADDPSIVLPYVAKEDEAEILEAYARTSAVRGLSTSARELADMSFYETVVRVHRMGEGAPYTGLKPAGLDVGPVIPAAERAVETGEPDELAELLSDELQHEIAHRLAHVKELELHAGDDVDHTRAYVEAMLGFEVWSHSLFRAVHASAHEHEHAHAA